MLCSAMPAPDLSTIMLYFILFMICMLAFAIRLFAIVQYESIIHEFDPHFNFRATKYLASEGFIDFLNWFDDRGWYPLGRTIGGTVYPGLMITAGFFYWILHFLHITVNIRNVCVFMGPLFASNCSLAGYLLTKEATNSSSAGLMAAAFLAMVPSYISRSMGGSYDYECVAIFILTFTFYLWVKSVNTGSMYWAAACALSYFYMVSAWGGYVFIINLIPIFTLAMLVAGRYNSKLYVAYTTFYVLGTLLSMQVPFVGHNVIILAECTASHGVFIALQAYAVVNGFYLVLGANVLKRLLVLCMTGVVGITAFILVSMQMMGKIEWSGRSKTLLDPTYASKFMPIIASVSEHQPTTWISFIFDLHILVPLSPMGLFFLFKNPTDGAMFLIIYGTLSWYFAGVMVRLMLTLAPIAAVLGAIALSAVMQKCSAALVYGKGQFSRLMSIILIILCTLLSVHFLYHSSYAARYAYSSPSIVIPGSDGRGNAKLYDDYREAYSWLRHNTDPDAKIASWWDYGYQMSSMSNRTVIVDNNTWNNTHIATVGRIMTNPEDKAYPILESLDIDYFLVIFGGNMGYSSDDINKLLWPVRISHGVYGKDTVSERDMVGRYGFDVGVNGNPNFHKSVAYRLCYKDYAQYTQLTGRSTGFDNVRNRQIAVMDIDLNVFEEAYTSENWLVRIYKVKPKPILDPIKGTSFSKIRKSSGIVTNNAKATYLGCFTSESFFEGAQYVGGASGASYWLLIEQAYNRKMPYFAFASNGIDGHSFVFKNLKKGVPKTGDTSGGGCEKSCVDDYEKACGCMDAFCSGPIPRGEINNRRWTVYQMDKE